MVPQRSGFRGVLVLLAGVAGCATTAAPQGARNDLAAHEFFGPDVLLPPTEGKARLQKAKPLKEKAYLYIEVTPPEAQIKVDGALKGTGSALVGEGKSRLRLVSISAPGYARIDGFAELTERQVVKIRATLHRAAALTVLTDPHGAEVTFDGEPAGHTPTTLRELEPGPHRVSLSMGGWTWSNDVDVDPNGTSLVNQSIPKDAVEQARRNPPPPVVAAPAPPPAPAPAPPPVNRQPSTVNPPPVKAPPPPPPPVVVAVPPPAVVAPPPTPVPAPAPAAAPGQQRADCGAVCGRYANAVSESATFRDIIRDQCRARCDKGDVPFSVCAWKAKTMEDVTACAEMPERQ